MNRIAFFWVGNQTSIPEAYVISIRMIHGNSIEVIQLSDLDTPSIAGVSQVLRQKLCNDIMVARLQAYSALEVTEEYTLFTDADCLLLNPLAIDSSNVILLTPRTLNFKINANYPEHYPEFEGKMISDVMPFLFGALAIRRNTVFFKKLLKICQELPTRFHRWYGDQVSLAHAVNNQLFDYGLLNPEIHLNIIKQAPTQTHINELHNKGVQLITFKGPASDKEINLPLSLHYICNLVESKNAS
jgi:hypothetical protein